MDFTQSCANTDPGISLFTMDEPQSSMLCSSSSTEDSSNSNNSMQEIDAKQILNNNHINNNINNDIVSSVSLRQQVMLNQFVSITGSSYEQALQLLISSDWQYQTALSIFFDDFSVTQQKIITTKNQTNTNTNNVLNSNCLNNLTFCAPSNTPVTPPNLDFLEKAFSKLNSTTSSATTATPIQLNNSVNTTTNINTNSHNLNNNNTKSHNFNTTNSVVNGGANNSAKLTFLPANSSGSQLRSQKSMPIQMPLTQSTLFCFNNNMN